MLLGDAEKEHMCRLIRRIEGFTGVRVLTYSVMTNHFHLLLEEPDRSEVVTDEEFARRMACLYSEQELDELYSMWDTWIDEGCDELVEADKQRYIARMHDISEFMKQLKQRFSRWFNRMNGRKGALWDARFKSVMVEPGTPLRVVAAYIEMNPVRAGMVVEPQFYRFGGFGEALGGCWSARKGIQKIVQTSMADVTEWESVSTEYLERILMYDEVRRHPERLCTDHDMLREKLGKRIELTDYERLLCKCRYFSDGWVIGGKAFVEAYFQENRDFFGPKRISGSRKVKGGWSGIYAAREFVDWD